MATRGFKSKISISIQSPNQSALSVKPFCLLRRATCHEIARGLGGWIDRSVFNLLLAQTRHLPRSRWGDWGLCPRLVCDGESSGAGVSGPVLACFVSDEGFVGLEWSAPNVSHEKGSPINQVSVVLFALFKTASPLSKAKSASRRTIC